MNDQKKPAIVILGGGFGGAYCAQALEELLKKDQADIVLIDRNNYFIFYPLLVEAGTGSLEPRHAVVSTRNFLKRATFCMAEVTGIEFEQQRVCCRIQGNEQVQWNDYDHLVLALGSVTNLPDIPGLREYGFEMKSLTDAVALRDRAILLMEMAESAADTVERRALLHFVVVGGNFTGVEAAGEFDVFLKKAARYYENVRPADCQVTLVEISDRILTAVDQDLSEYATEHMRRRGMDIRLETTVSRIEPSHVVLNTGETLHAHTVVWCAGIAPSRLIAQLPIPVDDRGYILCENDLRVQELENVWAIGDCAVNVDENGKPYPATAQHAVGEARVAARNIARVLNGDSAQPCKLSSKGALAALGCRTAVAKVFGIKLSGFPAWFLWRTVYLFKMPGWARRLRVALEWTMDLLFRRDYVQLGVHRVREAGSGRSEPNA
jgi:NADH dehydrogenase